MKAQPIHPNPQLGAALALAELLTALAEVPSAADLIRHGQWEVVDGTVRGIVYSAPEPFEVLGACAGRLGGSIRPDDAPYEGIDGPRRLHRLSAQWRDVPVVVTVSAPERVRAVEALGTAVRNAQDSDDAVLRCLTCGEDLDDENISDYCSEACGGPAAWRRQGRRTPAELAEACASHTAQIEELRQAVTVLRLRVAGLTDAADLVVADGEASCCVCGCTEDRPCVGGCHWVPAPRMRDLCSACAAVIPGSPTQTAADEWVTCANPRGCPRREKAAKAAVMGWEDGLCPQCAAHAADRLDFLAAERGERP